MVLCRQLLMCLALISKEAMYISMSLLESVHTSASEITRTKYGGAAGFCLWALWVAFYVVKAIF